MPSDGHGPPMSEEVAEVTNPRERRRPSENVAPCGPTNIAGAAPSGLVARIRSLWLAGRAPEPSG